jgi:hypothetical protein
MESSDSGALVMSMKAQKANESHTLDDHIQARITMVEAMDDSYLFATTLTTLQRLWLKAERFQYAYRWITEWAKTKVFIIHPLANGMPPTMILMPLITITEGVHPWTISWCDISLKTGELKFL